MIIFDIETGALPEDQLRAKFDAEYHAPSPPGVFDPSTVKYGQMKDPDKRAAKLADERAKHEAAVRDFSANAERAKSEAWQEFVSKAALSPITGQVLAIGMQSMESGKIGIDGDGVDELELIERFWLKYRQCREKARRMCGYNIFGFDLPFLIRRSWLLGVDVPATVFESNGRYLDSRVFVDLMQLWGCGLRDYCKLDELTKAFGIGGKPVVNGVQVNGSHFAGLWATDRPKAIEYLTNDLFLEAALASRLGVVA